MKKLFISFFCVFLLFSCFKDGVNPPIVINEENVKPESELDKCVNNIELSEISGIYTQIRDNYSDPSVLAQLSDELLSIEWIATKNCSVIVDDYAKNICNIYVSWNYSELDNFKFEEWESKEEYILFFDSLKQWKIIEWEKEKLSNQILEFSKSIESIEFDFSNINSSFRADYHYYYKINGKEKFFDELDSQFLVECKKNIDEKVQSISTTDEGM